MSEHELYYSNFSTGYWAKKNPKECPCKGHGWVLSEVDTWHKCRLHFQNQPHPEAECESPEACEEESRIETGCAHDNGTASTG